MSFAGFLQPETPQEAVAMHAEYGGRALYCAGATDILVAAREDETLRKKILIDINGLEQLRSIHEENDMIQIGALCTHAEIAKSDLIRRYCGALSKGCLSVGSPQIRNRGTIGGNIGNASPAADLFGPLALLRANVMLLGENGLRSLPLNQVVAGPYRNTLEENELVLGVTVDKLDGYRQDYYKLGRREALAISRLTVSAAARLDGNGTIMDLRVALGAALPKPLLFEDVDALAVGKTPSDKVAQQVAEALSQKLPEIAGIRASTRYKQPVSRNLTLRMLRNLLEVSERE